MKIESLRKSIMRKLLSLEKKATMEKINAILDEETTVANTADGKPLTLKDYNKRLNEAEQQIRSGKYLTQEEAEKEADKW
jgi:hypothetical protein